MEFKDLQQKRNEFNFTFVQPKKKKVLGLFGSSGFELINSKLLRQEIKIGEVAENQELIERIIVCDLSDELVVDKLKLDISKFLYNFFKKDNPWIKKEYFISSDYEQLLKILGEIIEDLKKKAKTARVQKRKTSGGDLNKR